jgi:mannose-6-phosphate isomerase-like protein (cupin superfamily)
MVLKSKNAASVELLPGAVQKRYWDETTGAGAVSMGMITLQPGTELKPHSHLVEDAMIVISGSGVFVLEGAETMVTVGDGMLAPANKQHYIRNNGKEPLVVVYTWPSVQVKRF